MKDEIIRELNFRLKVSKKTMSGMAKFCGVSRPTIAKLVNEGSGTIELLERARNFFDEEIK